MGMPNFLSVDKRGLEIDGFIAINYFLCFPFVLQHIIQSLQYLTMCFVLAQHKRKLLQFYSRTINSATCAWRILFYLFILILCTCTRCICAWHVRVHISIVTSRLKECGWCPLSLWAFLLLKQGLSQNLELMLYNHIASSIVSLSFCLVACYMHVRHDPTLYVYWDPNLHPGTCTSNLWQWTFSSAWLQVFNCYSYDMISHVVLTKMVCNKR